MAEHPLVLAVPRSLFFFNPHADKLYFQARRQRDATFDKVLPKVSFPQQMHFHVPKLLVVFPFHPFLSMRYLATSLDSFGRV